MYIAPNSIIKVYNNVPLDNSYNHTLYFNTRTEQTSYFSSNAKYTFSTQSYQRVEKGKMRVDKKAEDIYDCNYLAFQNTSFGNKWFYAFITGVEYINNSTTEISFEIDTMQTYMFDVNLRECFVEREHSKTDNIGDNIMTEPVATGEYINSDYGTLDYGLSLLAVVALVTGEDESYTGNLYDGVYGGCKMYAFGSNDVGSIQSFLSNYIANYEQVVSLYMCPTYLLPPIPVGGLEVDGRTSASITDKTLIRLSGNEKFGNYTPHNKKLYTYPYNFLRVDNANGGSLDLRYEFFKDLTPTFAISGSITTPVKVVLRPTNYKGVGDSSFWYENQYTSEFITLESYPICSWNINAYQAWVAQNSVPVTLNFGTSIGQSILTGNPLNFVSSVIGNVSNVVSKIYSASIMADQCRGNTSTGNANVSSGMQMFYKQRTHITEDFAKMIDNYFDMFGYATNKVKYPNVNSRPHWNYVKTNGCVITSKSGCPADEIKKMCSIYDNGITFWKNASEVGRYDLDNSVDANKEKNDEET